MHEEVETAELLIDPPEDRVDVRVRRHVARQHQRRLFESLRELPHVLFEASLIRQRESRAAPGRCLSDGPRK